MKPQSDHLGHMSLNRQSLAAWFLERLRPRSHSQTRLAVLDREMLAPRQSLALVEAEGRWLLVATSPEGSPAFYAIEKRSTMRTVVWRPAVTVRIGR